MASYDFHPDALVEFEDATRYYLEQASPIVASAFVAAVESAIKTVIASPMVWRIIDEPGVRRYLLSRFPYAVYYRWDPERDRVSIYAVMHLRRRPGYWKSRLTEKNRDA
jgi:plasmid stabilization system protein ParE